MLTYKEKNVLLATGCAQKLAESLAIPEERFHQEGIRFRYYKKDEPDNSNSENIILLEVTKDGKGEVILRVGVSRVGTDLVYSSYLFEAGKTLEEVKGWLKNSDVCVPCILRNANILSDRVDEYWN